MWNHARASEAVGRAAGGLAITQGTSNDDDGHGTHVAGIIAGRKLLGATGSAPDAEVYAVKVLDGNGNGSTSWVIAGIGWAAARGMEVCNLSLEHGRFGRSSVERRS
ncbi:S8 family serine peptidase [Bradyrhizobium sp. Pa8]|uniref:S8 family serine peptidase n=1 Tax=Bradyrhizobium sp. Pa8 TaxID=3386552 RepID=UPI00403F5407